MKSSNNGSIGFLLGLNLCLVTSAFALPDGNTIEFSNCTLSMPGTVLTTEAQCGFLDVAENPDEPDGKQIAIHVAIAPAVSRAPQSDPLFFLAGGPGQSASEAYVALRRFLEKIRKDRDIVLVDQRGTGQSNPLKCIPEESETLETAVDLEKVADGINKCLAELNGDPLYYTTSIGMSDIDRVREAMGYEKINLLGISYGTRAAQVYLRQYPDRVRSVILDSVVPMELNLGQEHAIKLDEAITKIIAACGEDTHCFEHYYEGANQVKEFIEQIRRNPREAMITDPFTGELKQLEVNADVLAVAIRFLAYSSESQAILPLLLHEAITTGNLQRLTSQAAMIMYSLDEQISRGMELSVLCSEDYPFMPRDLDVSDTILGQKFFEVIKTSCERWPKGEVVIDFHEPVQSDVPVLLLTGSLDPVTPPEYARQAAVHFSNSRVIEAKGLGHSVITNYCLNEIANAFVENASVDGLDIACVDEIEPAPFFTSILGPAP